MISAVGKAGLGRLGRDGIGRALPGVPSQGKAVLAERSTASEGTALLGFAWQSRLLETKIGPRFGPWAWIGAERQGRDRPVSAWHSRHCGAWLGAASHGPVQIGRAKQARQG